MNRHLILLAAFLPIVCFAKDDGLRDTGSWSQWRGPLGSGTAPNADPPLTWSETRNIRWKTPLPGRGTSSPVVHGAHIFLTTAIPTGDEVEPTAGRRPGEHDNLLKVRKTKFVVLAINRKDGTIRWQTTVREEVPHESHHLTGSYASASPVTDGEHVFAFFGSRGIYCLDLHGKVIWQSDPGDMETKHAHGEGSSPALFGDTLIVNWDHEGPSFVVALDKRTGKQLWKASRDEPTSWSTPHILIHDGKPQVVIAATNRIRSYDLGSGKILWECGGLSHNVVASPVSESGVLVAGSSYEKQAILGIRLAGSGGDITGTDQIGWVRFRDTPYVPSLLLHKGLVYFLRHYQGVLTCIDIKTGKEIYARFRLPGIRNVYASPVATRDRIYITSLEGDTLVITAGPDPKPIASNHLDDTFRASAALIGKELILRGEKSLYSIVEQ